MTTNNQKIYNNKTNNFYKTQKHTKILKILEMGH